MDEFELVRRFFRRDGAVPGVELGIGDDAALLNPSPDCQLVMTMDTLVQGRHFPEDLPPEDIGWRSLAVNLSDLAAMGAEPRWCLLSLSLPVADEAWLAAFASGFFQLAEEAGIALVGGDTVRGSLAVTVQATGEVPRGGALRRAGAGVGERICIGGAPGEAAAGLQAWQSGARGGALVRHFARPGPQLSLGLELRGVATACIDVSDGLLADLGHILEASGGWGAELRDADVPVSADLAGWGTEESRQAARYGGGDDYLLLFTLPAGAPLPAGCSEIGTVVAEPGIRVLDATGKALSVVGWGWKHFP